MKSNNRKIYVTSINAYCGGTIALAALCKTLRELNYDARLLLLPYFPNEQVARYKFIYDYIKFLLFLFIKLIIKKWLHLIFPNASVLKQYRSEANILKIKGIKIQWIPIFDNTHSVVVYSEDIYGNPLNFKNVVRWLLYHYDYIDDQNAYSKNDLFIAYREIFNVESLNPQKYIVTICYFNNDLYKQTNFSKRNGICYIIHKGINRTDLPKKFDGPIFDSKMSQEDLVCMLNEHKFCYCYDPQSFYMTIAAVCGCIPILIMEKGKSANDYLSPHELHYGIAYGNTPEQIEYAISTRQKCIDSLDFTTSNLENAKKFMEILEKKYGHFK